MNAYEALIYLFDLMLPNQMPWQRRILH